MKAITKPDDLALFGGVPAFDRIRSTSNLVKPDEDVFFSYLKQSFDSRRMTNNGPMVQLLEERLAQLHETKHCIAACNGFWAIALCIKALALEGKEEIIMPAMTYRRLADISAWTNLTPHFCDIDKITLSADVESVEACINDRTALILIAHPIVNVSDINALTEVSERRGIPLLFDSVEASYASYNGRMIGSFGEAECFSMHASKLLNGFEGGYITTNNSELANNLKLMRGFGFAGQDRVVTLGLNAKMNEMHAAMSLACLDDLPQQVQRNKARYEKYRDLLDPIEGISLVTYDDTETRGYKNILVELTDSWPLTREQTIEILHAENMLVRPYYFPPLHQKKTSYKTIHEKLSVAEYLTLRYMLMPSGEFVSLEDIEVIATVLEKMSRMSADILAIAGGS